VSIATVSRALNGQKLVAPSTLQSIMKAAEELGYVSRAVRPGRKPLDRQGIETGTIAFLSVGQHPPSMLYRLAGIASFLGGIHRGVETHGLALALAHSPGGHHIPTILARRQVDGVILFCDEPLSSTLTKLLKHIPTVWGFRASFDSQHRYDHVVYDNARVGHMAAEYLIERGCRHLVFASLDVEHIAFAARRNQFRQAAADAGLQVAVVEGVDAINASGRNRISDEVVGRINQRSSSEKIGVFCASDDLMLPVFHALHRHGLEPGRDVELIGCNNDSVMMAQMHPHPATIDIKMDAVGGKSVDQLFWRISNRQQPTIEVRIVPEIVPAERCLA
jgi:DNA-binding LacI/PurR family transcriptional regulator